MSVYLDYNASAPVLPEVLDVMIDTYRNVPGNADSRTHIYGTTAGKLVLDCRSSIASILGVDQSEVIFTAGSTESNNTCILGIEDYVRLGRALLEMRAEGTIPLPAQDRYAKERQAESPSA